MNNSIDLAKAYNLSTSSLQCLTNWPVSTHLIEGNRTVWNIVWSSLTTIFACTWVSRHPNISFDRKKLMKMKKDLGQESDDEHDETTEEWWKGVWHSFQIPMIRIKIILVALIAPEVIVMWSLRQYMAAKSIVRKFEGLTMTHAFFSLMEGFIITDQKQNPVRVMVLDLYGIDHFLMKNLAKTIEAHYAKYVNVYVEAITVSVKAAIAANKESRDGGTGFSLAGTNLRLAAADGAGAAIADVLKNEILAVLSESDSFATVIDHEVVDRLADASTDVAATAVSIALDIVVNECEVEDVYESDDEPLSREPQGRHIVRLRRRVQDRLRDRLQNILRVT